MMSLAAAPRPGVVVTVDPCLELDEEVLRGTVEHELGPGLEHRGGAAAGAEDTQIVIDCGAEGEAEISVIDPLSDSSTTRTLPLPPLERRAEQLGWEAVNSLRGVWFTLVPTRSEGPARRAARVARRDSAVWIMGDSFAVRGFFGAGSPGLMLGEQVEILHRPLRHLAWKADGELAYFRVPVSEGDLSGRVNTLSISAAPVLFGYGEIPSSRPRGRGTVAIYGGAGLRLGGVRMRSETFGDSQGFQLYAGPMTSARLSVSTGRYVRLALQGELGWMLHGPERPQGIPLSFVGPWGAAAITIVSAF